MTYYISAKRFYFDHKVKEGGYLAVTDGSLVSGQKMYQRVQKC